MKQYLALMQHALEQGTPKGDRTGTGTLSVFGYQMRFNLQDGFPLVTTKKCHLRSIIHELLWFLNGDTNISYLKENNVSIWDEWADENGDLGPVYGKQWRSWQAADGRQIDQLSKVIEQLKNDPDSRRIIVSAWNVGELDDMALVPCHSFFQFYTRKMSYDERLAWVKENCWESYDAWTEATNEALSMQDIDHSQAADELVAWVGEIAPERILSCQLYQRSCDIFLGLPFNIASYALLVHMVAQQCDMAVGDFVWTGGDTHLYSNHLEQTRLQLSREPRALPTLVINRKPESLFDYRFEDFDITGYDPHPAIKAPVAV